MKTKLKKDLTLPFLPKVLFSLMHEYNLKKIERNLRILDELHLEDKETKKNE